MTDLEKLKKDLDDMERSFNEARRAANVREQRSLDTLYTILDCLRLATSKAQTLECELRTKTSPDEG